MNSNDTPNLPEPQQDPHPVKDRFCARQVSFDYPVGSVAPKRLVGTVIRQAYIGKTKRGEIPNYSLTVVGNSGKILVIDMVESYALIQ